ncbi:unnamed protein product [Protopolystoma xenopodis]|uniref:Uncharacterized protein n=1 Tax=Protopolystoma xenopodis TaxID=117903 RepID=A0A3S5BWR4_9PLAT|nr:unnamed protein product [Protopolystoma xenopodis]
MVDAHQAKSLKEIKDKELLAPVDFSLFEGPDGVGPPLLDSSSLRKDESSTKNAKGPDGVGPPLLDSSSLRKDESSTKNAKVLATSDKLSVKQSINRRANEKSCNRNKSRYAVSDVEPSSSTIRPSDNSNVIHFIKELGANSNSSGLPVSSSYSCTNTSDTTKSPLVHLTSNHKSSNDKNSDSVLRSLTAQLSTLMTSRSMSLSQGLTEQLNPQHTMTQQKNACNLAQLRVSHLPETSVPPTDRAMVSLMSRDPIGDKWLSPSGHRVPRLSAAQRRCLLQYLTLGRIEAPLSSTSIAVAHGFGWSRLVETAARALIDNIWSGLHCADAQGLPTCNGQR